MKLIIAGSRSITSYSILLQALSESKFLEPPKLLLPSDLAIVSGGARGVDRLGEEWARRNHVTCITFKAEWDVYGRSAGYVRNEQMAEYADALLVVWNSVSRGAKHMIDMGHKHGLDVYVYRIRE